MYEHFPSVAESLSDLDYDEMSPHAYRWIATKVSLKSLPASTYRKRLDGLTIANVCWMPYGDHCVVHDFDLISCFLGHIRWGPVVIRHRPKRVVRQFGYVQTIPPQTNVIIWRYWRQVDAFLWLSCSSGTDLCCAKTMCIRLHAVVFHDFSSIHDTGTACWSGQTSTYDVGWHICGATYP